MTNFISILEQSALKETDKITLRTLADYYNYKHPAELCSRSVLFTGNVGTGKTHLAISKILGTEEQEHMIG